MAATAAARAAIKLWYYSACVRMPCSCGRVHMCACGCVRACVVCVLVYVRVGTCWRIHLPHAHRVYAR